MSGRVFLIDPNACLPLPRTKCSSFTPKSSYLVLSYVQIFSEQGLLEGGGRLEIHISFLFTLKIILQERSVTVINGLLRWKQKRRLGFFLWRMRETSSTGIHRKIKIINQKWSMIFRVQGICTFFPCMFLMKLLVALIVLDGENIN